MGAHDVFRVVAIILAIATTVILVTTKRIKSRWIPWLAVPVLAFVWYWVLVCLYVGYYMLQIDGVR